MPSNCMCVQVEGIDLKVYPVERKSLYQPKYSLTKESVDAHCRARLVQDAQYTGSEDQCNKGIRSLYPVLDVGAWEKFQTLLPAGGQSALDPSRSLNADHKETSEQIEQDGDPDQALSARLLDMYAADPKCHGDQRDDAIADHGGTNHGDQICVP